MCGICCIYGHCDVTEDPRCMENECRLSRRGPDISDTKHVTIYRNQTLTLIGHVLHLRGQLTPQPLSDNDGNILLWNGEVFGGIEISEEENDTEVLLNLLSKSSDNDHIIQVMSKVQGPWAFIYWQETTQSLWFGRDVFGRRSLLWHLPESNKDNFILSSTKITDNEYREVPSVGLFCITFQKSCDGDTCDLHIHLYPWHRAVWPGTMDKVDASELQHRLYPSYLNNSVRFTIDTDKNVSSQMPVLNKDIPSSDLNETIVKDVDPKTYIQELIKIDHYFNTLSDQLIQVLQLAVYKRVYNQPDLKRSSKNKPCSDCGRSLSHHSFVDKLTGDGQKDVCLEKSHHFKQQKFRTQLASEKLSSENFTTNSDINDSFSESEQSCYKTCDVTKTFVTAVSQPEVSESKHLQSVIAKSCDNENMDDVVSAKDTGAMSAIGENESFVNSESVISNASVSATSNLETSSSLLCDKSAKVAILFSGGIDSAVLTALVDRVLPPDEPVDLLNVAFEQQNRQTNSKIRKHNEDERWNVPDRLTGYTALSELNPNRKWNFVLVNVTVEELKTIRSNHVRHLVYPLDTVLDDSIGCAVWFAARGMGYLGNGSHIGQPYTSTAKVILCGMGADEQFAGYARHRGKYQENGWQGLIEEIDLEVSRISARNLGRDDRIITDHGKESRFPFLDENVVSFLSQLPVHQKANLDLPRGLGEKLLLRVSATKLGLNKTAVFPKRAIQFGSRIAKIENSKEKASDKCNRLTE